MGVRRRSILRGGLAAPVAAQAQLSRGYSPPLTPNVVRPWIGRDFWANPLQDWRLASGRIECIVSGGDRNIFLLTREVEAGAPSFDLAVELGRMEEDKEALTEGFAGFRVGIRGYWGDYRDAAVRGSGLDAGITTDGRLFIGEPKADDSGKLAFSEASMTLRLRASGGTVRLEAIGTDGKQVAAIERTQVPDDWLAGGVALVCHAGPIAATPIARSSADTGFASRRGTAREGNVRFWFRNFLIGGNSVRANGERAFGPLLFNQYCVTRGVMKMSVQCAPIDTAVTAEFQVRENQTWNTIAKAPMEQQSATVLFRIEKWDDSRNVPYRIRLPLDGLYYELQGTVAHNPKEKNRLVIGALTCQNDMGFPHRQIYRNLTHLKPDILFFTGDQIYERSGDYGNQTQPEPVARLDYLRKWFLFGWAWGPLTANIPCVCLPDDHDVYHGNLWGSGGRKAVGQQSQQAQDSGGYKMPASWVNMVQRTQTCHLPDPPDPTPVEQGISVHYCHVQWGWLSFAVLEDRKWKSAPKEWMPQAEIVNGWPQNLQWNAARDGDVPGAQLLGERQEKFLEEWVKDWSGGTYAKAVVSATIFCNLATLPPPATTDAVTTKLPVQPIGGYAEGEVPTMDHDSNAWPQTPRNRVLRLLRKALAFHIAGDQHLASTVQYGVENWNDSAFAICTPAISNIFPRRWFPPAPGRNAKPHSPRNTGEFTDAFGNKMTVHAVGNPALFGVAPENLTNRAVGFGCIEMYRDSRKIVMTNWPYWVDVSKSGAKPYDGWPVTILQTDNGLPRTGWVLPEVKQRAGLPPRVISVVRQADGELIYMFRLRPGSFRPPVPGGGHYTVRLFDPDTGAEEVRREQEATIA